MFTNDDGKIDVGMSETSIRLFTLFLVVEPLRRQQNRYIILQKI